MLPWAGKTTILYIRGREGRTFPGNTASLRPARDGEANGDCREDTDYGVGAPALCRRGWKARTQASRQRMPAIPIANVAAEIAARMPISP